MFVGHIAVGLASKRVAPRLSLGTLFIACQLADLIWPVLVIAGVERVRVDASATAFTPFDFEYYPWSHSLGMSLVWSVAAFGALKLFRRTTLEAAVVALVVFSHWVLDVLTHRPDVPVWFGGGTKLGLGLWNSVAATVLVELSMFAVGAWIYVRATAPRNRKGTWAFWTLMGFLLLAYLANAFGPQPPDGMSAAAIAGPALAFWLLVAWAYWADRQRGPSPDRDG